MNYLIYPLKVMNITQNYKDNFTHRRHTTGYPKDYPIDDNCGSNSKTGYFYCPCDEMVVKKIYGVGLRSTSVLWLQSTSKVVTPTFNDYVTIMIAHSEDIDFKNIYVGKKYKRFDKIVQEGKDGFATGYHFHIVVGRGKFKSSGWVKNNEGIWIINTTGGGIRPEETFFIDKMFTRVMNSKNIKFTFLEEKYDEYFYVTAASLNVRFGPGMNYKIRNTLPCNTKVKVFETKGSWSRISDNEWVSSNYLSKTKPRISYETKKTTASYLNVRNKPNGKKLTYKAPLIKNTTVAVMKNSGGWTMINKNRWVFSFYLK